MIFFFFNDTATTEIYTLSLHDALPILTDRARVPGPGWIMMLGRPNPWAWSRSVSSTRPSWTSSPTRAAMVDRSEEHTSELQSRQYLVCRLLLEKKKIYPIRCLYGDHQH